ncbi:MAG: glycosyltransferase, partial [Acholeplasmataceae bacterium]|nr:glycosyltransferase [Acholeplasmataceae bacterium]
KSQLKQPYYAKYLKKIIKKNNMQDHVIFLGNLSEEEMVKRFLKTHVFISPSIIENESNSLSEAKILGCPSVASYVGGVTNRILHGVDGFLYPLQETYMMEYYIDQIFSHDDLAIQISTQARINAHQLHDREKNLNQMISIYKSILKD